MDTAKVARADDGNMNSPAKESGRCKIARFSRRILRPTRVIGLEPPSPFELDVPGDPEFSPRTFTSRIIFSQYATVPDL